MKHTIRDGHIGEFRPDPGNTRAHTPRNVAMIEHALHSVGAGRSLVATKEGTIIAGNATLDAAAAAGIEHAIVIHSDGHALIIHQRDDLSDQDMRATQLSVFDNRASDLSTFDVDRLADVRADYPDIFASVWTDDEWTKMFERGIPADSVVYDSDAQLGALEYRVVVDCDSESAQADLIAELQTRGLTCRALIS